MPNLTDSELRALTYYAIGVSTEGSDIAYELSFCGHNTHKSGILDPIGNSGYTIGEMQTDMGANRDVAKELIKSYQDWTKTNHKDWTLNDDQQAKFAAYLGRNGNHIRDQNYNADNQKYKEAHHGKHIPSGLLPNTGRDIDSTFKVRLNEYLATDAGKTFVHQNDVTQVEKLITNVEGPLELTKLYQGATPEDQAKIFAVVAKAYNQSPKFATQILEGINDGQIKNLHDVSKKIDTFPDGKHKFRSSRPEFRSAGWRKPANSTVWLVVSAHLG